MTGGKERGAFKLLSDLFWSLLQLSQICNM